MLHPGPDVCCESTQWANYGVLLVESGRGDLSSVLSNANGSLVWYISQDVHLDTKDILQL